jgi:hypothetical protein
MGLIPFFQKKKLILAEEMIRQNNIIIDLLKEISLKVTPAKKPKVKRPYGSGYL